MNNKQTPSLKKRGATVAAVLCFVAAIAIVGTYTWSGYSSKQQSEELAKTEDADTTEEKEEAAAADSQEIENDVTDDGQLADDINVADSEIETTTTDTSDVEIYSTEGVSTNVNFTEDSTILWPLDNGSVLMNYSMDQTIYYETLDQYKYNPALIISGAEGDPVLSAADGIVTSIDLTAQTGTTVDVDLGNGYEVIYGQLKEVPLSIGDYVEAGQVVGYVSQPTKYYSVEGSNLYFEMRKDGLPVNPEDYLDYAEE